jgi:hypothetical protein
MSDDTAYDCNETCQEHASCRGDDGTQRTFKTGATRSSAEGRIDPEGFLSPLSLERYCQYLLKHQVQADGNVRESDNWQKGMPLRDYIKGMFRHFLHFWTRHRGYEPMDDKAGVDIQEDLCAIMFNAQGYLHELLKLERVEIDEEDEPKGTFLTMSETSEQEPAGLTFVWPKPIDYGAAVTFPRTPDYVPDPWPDAPFDPNLDAPFEDPYNPDEGDEAAGDDCSCETCKRSRNGDFDGLGL